ncbi:T9SS type A sorting domain-containing protein [Pontibacter pamirensis]|uniref:T9SS type A sorting domain-containing protein n=1 Tax=Pontibacter pamirensis TaxID=2562824 RepID=UPI0021CF7FDA|nr:T9SS type A sorting domain-containing protein [Pontibacter pamirensis]
MNPTTITATLPETAFATSGTKDIVVTNPTPASNNGVSLGFPKQIRPLSVFPIEGPSSICASTSNSNAFSVQTGPNITSYTWKVKSGDATIVSGETSANPRITFGSTAGKVVLSVIEANFCGAPGPEVTKEITVNPRPDVTLNASKTEICASESVELSASGAESYVWSGGAIHAGTTGERITVTPTATTTYTVVGSNSYTVDGITTNCPTTKTVTINVTPALSQGSITGATQLCQNQTVAAATALTATVSGGVTSKTYLWEQSANAAGPWDPATGTNNELSYTPSTATAGTTYYRRTVTSGNCSVTHETPVAVTVTPAIANNTITGTQNVCSGDDIALLDGAAATAGDLQVAYFWEQRAAGTTTWAAAEGINTTNEDYQPATREVTSPSTIEYRRGVRAGNCVNYSNEVTVTVNPLPIATITQGTNTYFCSPGTALLSAAEEAGSYSYTWFRIESGGHVEVANTRTTEVGVVGTYYVVVTNNNTSCKSTSSTISVQETVVGNNIVGVDNGNQEVCYNAIPEEIVGSTASSTVGPVTYQWEVSLDNETFTNLTGATGINLTQTQLGAHTADRWYRRKAIVGSCTNTSAETVHISVKPELLLTPGTTTPDAICSGETFSYTPTSNAPANSTYAWSRADVDGISNPEASGTGTINEVLINISPRPLEVTYVYKITTPENCESALQYVTVVVNPRPVLNSATTELAVCSNTPFTYTATTATTSLPAPTFTWTRAAVAGISNAAVTNPVAGATINETLVNETTAPIDVTYIYRITAYGCEGPEQNVVVTVNPTTTVNAISDVNLCNSEAGAAITFGSPVSGTTYTWTSSADVGFGTGSSTTPATGIPAYTATNTGTSPVTATVTVTPSANGCPGTPRTFTVTVNPTTTVNAISDVNLCNSEAGAAITFGSPVSGTTYTWTSTANVGFGTGSSTTPATGIPAYTATNTGTSPVTATVTVTPTANGCPGTPRTFTVTVNPTPTVNAISDVTLCNGAPGAAITFGSPVSGTTYTWTSTANVGFGTGSSTTMATGIPAYTATITGTTAVTATVTVTPTANGCPGTPRTFTVRVNPTPVATFSGVENGQTVYSGAGSITFVPTGTTGGTFSIVSPTGTSGLSGNTLNLCTALGTATEKDVTIRYSISIGTAPNNCSATEEKTFKIKKSTYRAVILADPHPFCRGVQVTYTTTIYRDLEPGDVIYPYVVDADGQPIYSDTKLPVPTGSSSFPEPNMNYPFPENTPLAIKNLAYRFFQPVVKPGLESKIVSRDAATYQWGKNHEVNRKNDKYFTTDAGLSSQDYYHVYVNLTQCGTVLPTIQSNRMYSAELPGYSATLAVAPNPICKNGSVTLTAELNTAFNWLDANTTVEFVLARTNLPLGPAQPFVDGVYTYTLTTSGPSGGFENGDQVYLRFLTDINNYETSKKCAANNQSNNVTINVVLPQAMTGGGAYCAGGAGVPVGLASSQEGVNYQLLRDGVAVGSPIAGTGNAISFGNQTVAGAYTVQPITASGSSCEVFGTVNVYVTPLPIAYNVTGGGEYCAGGTGVPVGLDNSQTGISYQLQLNNVAVGSPVAGITGSPINFGNQTAAGTYTVLATTIGSTTSNPPVAPCPQLMNGSKTVVINALPELTLSSPPACIGSEATVTASVTNGTAPYTYTWTVPQGADNPGNVSTFNTAVAGEYKVEVTDDKSCPVSGTTTVVINQPTDQEEPILEVIWSTDETQWFVKVVEKEPLVSGELGLQTSPEITWYRRVKPGTDWGSPVQTGTSTTYTETNSREGEGVELKAVLLNAASCVRYTLTNIGVVPLPVEIIYLTASKQGNNVLLEWATASETDNKGFEVQVSEDGLNYRLLDFVPSRNGNSNTKQVYAFTDKENGKDGTRYYRLKQIDHAGTFEFFGPKMVTFGSVSSKVIAFPNPFNDEITLDISSETDGEMLVVITDAVGKQLIERKVQVEKGFTTEKMKFGAGLPRGLYIIRTQIGGFTQFIKMVKE